MKRHRHLPAVRVDEWLLPIFMLLLFAIGGGSRADTLSLVVLRPLAVVFAGLAIARAPMATFIRHRFILGTIVASAGLVALHLIPLPFGVWSALPGRELLVAAGAIDGAGQRWRPLTMVPYAGWNALFSFVVPFAAYCCWCVTPADRRRDLLALLICVGLASAALGALQITTQQFYLYRLTTIGSPVGLFANRNHQAVFLTLLIPMMAVYASLAKDDATAKRRGIATIAIGLLLTPILLVIGSRAGLLAGIIAAISAIFLYRAPQRAAPRGKKQPPWAMWMLVAAFAIVLAIITVVLARAEALTRLLQTGGTGEVRAENWKTVFAMIGNYLPLGSGAGSFVEVFQIHEPLSQITYTYFNHAHNEPMEIALTLGIPGIALLVLSIGAWLRASVALWRAGKVHDWQVTFGQLGSTIILILGLASLVDYPLRTPSLAALATVAALWMAAGYARTKSGKDGETSNGR